jgi:hypothetical protein
MLTIISPKQAGTLSNLKVFQKMATANGIPIALLTSNLRKQILVSIPNKAANG